VATVLSLELNDAALAVVDGSGLKALEPGLAVATEEGIRLGAEALPHWRRMPRQLARHHWRAPSRAPLVPALPGVPTVADLVRRHLERLVTLGGGRPDALVVAVPPGWGPGEAGLFLELVRELGLPVAGLVDSAVAATRSEHPGRDLLHLEAGLQGLWLSRIAQTGQASLAGREHLPGPGIEALTRVCAEFLARRFIECSRFDPLHDADTEQLLHDRLPEWLARIAREPETTLEITTAAGRFTAVVGADALRSRVALLCEPLLQKLRATVTARGPVALQVHHRLGEFPGVLETLLRVPGALVRTLEPGAAARGALARLTAVRAASPDGSAVLTALPFDASPVTAGAEVSAGGLRRPSHILLGHQAWRLGREPFGIGTELGEGERGLRLDAGRPGVSRRHCTIRPENGALMVFDHSRFGTFLNGHRIEGSAVLEPGDRLSLGSPPVELTLIAESD
jgi:hypothetical protein